MNQKEKTLLNLLQFDFPLVQKPFALLGRQLGWTEAAVIARIKKLKARGIIRRIGGVFEAAKLRHQSVLVAAKLPSINIALAGRVVAGFPEVTHAYIRSHEFNFWFTLTAKSKGAIKRTAEKIKREAGLTEYHLLPAIKRFKIDTKFKL